MHLVGRSYRHMGRISPLCISSEGPISVSSRDMTRFQVKKCRVTLSYASRNNPNPALLSYHVILLIFQITFRHNAESPICPSNTVKPPPKP